VWSWRPDAGAKLSRTQFAKVTGAKEPGPRGEHEVTVKTIAQGRPDDPAPPVVTTVCFLPMHTGRGCELAPGLPCALLFRRDIVFAKLGRLAPRQRGVLSMTTRLGFDRPFIQTLDRSSSLLLRPILSSKRDAVRPQDSFQPT
jgi:hypothetical protein